MDPVQTVPELTAPVLVAQAGPAVPSDAAPAAAPVQAPPAATVPPPAPAAVTPAAVAPAPAAAPVVPPAAPATVTPPPTVTAPAAPAAQPVAVAAPAPGQGGTVGAIHGDPLAQEVAHDEGHFGAEVLLLMALAILVAIIWKPASRAIIGGLDGRAERIRRDIEEAARLREEAQAALAAYQRKQRDAMDEAAAIVNHARQEAERLRVTSLADLEEMLKRREAQAMDRIAQAEQAAAAEVRNIAVDVAINASRKLIADQLEKAKSGAGLIDAAIEDLPRRLH